MAVLPLKIHKFYLSLLSDRDNRLEQIVRNQGIISLIITIIIFNLLINKDSDQNEFKFGTT